MRRDIGRPPSEYKRQTIEQEQRQGLGVWGQGSEVWLDELIEKIYLVESGGRANPPAGDGGRAAGAMQLHRCVVDDVNFYYGENFSYADRNDVEKAKQMARLYITHWLGVHKEEIAARIYNGGPRGWQKKQTDTYWGKIKAIR